jgi:hypothetical protein
MLERKWMGDSSSLREITKKIRSATTFEPVFLRILRINDRFFLRSLKVFLKIKKKFQFFPSASNLTGEIH